MRPAVLFLAAALLLTAAPPRWGQDGPQRWTYRTDRADIAYVLRDGVGYWGVDVSTNRPRTVCLVPTLDEAERRVERWEQR